MSSDGPFFVYFLATTTRSITKTYIGATIDLERRLRQHNGEIKGGARATHGYPWKRIAYVSGFPTWQAALQFEWRWKQLSRRLGGSTPPVERRKSALNILLSLNQSTSKAVPYAEWPSPPEVHWAADTTTT
jgi:structure-specific endonuclease subunit SLX1